MVIQPSAGELVVAFAGAALLVACCVALVLHVAVAIAAIRLHLRGSRERRADARWHAALSRAATGEWMPNPIRVRRIEAASVLELWIARRDAVVDGRGLVALASSSGLIDAARRLARTRRTDRSQIAAVIALGWFGERRDVRLLERMVRRGREPLATAALASLLRLDVADAYPALRTRLRRGAQPLPVLLTTALIQARGTAVARLLRDEAETRGVELPGLLRILALQRDADGVAAVRAALVHPDADAEVLAAALYALAEIGRPTDVRFATRLLRHEDWTVRVRAVHAVARLGGRAYTGRVVRLLDDVDPWVRRRAAEVVVRDPQSRVDTAQLSERAQLAYAEALTRFETAA
jgi:HEAT repeat protein